MVKIAGGAGHGGRNSTAGKRTPDGEYEWNFNDAVLRAMIAKLNEYENVEILRVDDATGKTDVPLQTRTNRLNAWKADAYVSIHHNANTGKWGAHTGVETYVYTQASAKSHALAKAAHPRLVGAMGLRDRGIKQANFHDLRESNCPAILTEGGYMDSTIDIAKMRDSAVLRNAGEAIALGLVAHFGLKPKVKAPVKTASEVKPVSKPIAKPPVKKDVHRVIADGKQIGAFSDDDNIIEEVRKALAKGAKKIEVTKV
jgi:N-acetylmuramoyl-L-alanine amidase